MAKTPLIAAVLVTCYVAGVRTDIQPGEPLPDLSPHDEVELKRMQAIVDVAEEARDEDAADKANAEASADYQASRQAVQAANASLDAGAPEAQPAAEKPAAKTAKTAKA